MIDKAKDALDAALNARMGQFALVAAFVLVGGLLWGGYVLGRDHLQQESERLRHSEEWLRIQQQAITNQREHVKILEHANKLQEQHLKVLERESAAIERLHSVLDNKLGGK